MSTEKSSGKSQAEIQLETKRLELEHRKLDLEFKRLEHEAAQSEGNKKMTELDIQHKQFEIELKKHEHMLKQSELQRHRFELHRDIFRDLGELPPECHGISHDEMGSCYANHIMPPSLKRSRVENITSKKKEK